MMGARAGWWGAEASAAAVGLVMGLRIISRGAEIAPPVSGLFTGARIISSGGGATSTERLVAGATMFMRGRGGGFILNTPMAAPAPSGTVMAKASNSALRRDLADPVAN